MLPPPDELLATLPPAVLAYIRALETVAAAQVARLAARVAELEARLGQTSANSARPPSSDGPHVEPTPPKAPSGKAKGGQPGHPRNDRPILPPATSSNSRSPPAPAFAPLSPVTPPDSSAHQIVECPPVLPHVTVYVRHRLGRPRGRHVVYSLGLICGGLVARDRLPSSPLRNTVTRRGRDPTAGSSFCPDRPEIEVFRLPWRRMLSIS